MGHPVDDFWAQLDAFDDYPPDVVAVPERLPGTAAFAASAGLYRQPGSHELPPFPFEGLMIVGHNLDSVDGYEARRGTGLSHGDEVVGAPPMSTWRGLYKLLDKADVPRDRFFFTNIFVGLKHGRPAGQFSAHPAPAFRQWCRSFLEHQVQTMRPRVVLSLGGPASRDIAGMALTPPWPIGSLPPPGVVRTQLAGVDTLAVAAHHTSMQKRIAADGAALGEAWHGADGG